MKCVTVWRTWHEPVSDAGVIVGTELVASIVSSVRRLVRVQVSVEARLPQSDLEKVDDSVVARFQPTGRRQSYDMTENGNHHEHDSHTQ